jgi:hypothetical protein
MHMSIDSLIPQIDAEITRLQQARALLAGGESAQPEAESVQKAIRKKRHKLSPEGRARLIAAVKRRWAAQSKAN